MLESGIEDRKNYHGLVENCPHIFHISFLLHFLYTYCVLTEFQDDLKYNAFDEASAKEQKRVAL